MGSSSIGCAWCPDVPAWAAEIPLRCRVVKALRPAHSAAGTAFYYGRMRVLRDTWRRESSERPAAARLALIGIGALVAGAALAGGGLVLLAQLIAGLALVPLSLATYIRLLPARPWTDGRDDGHPGWGGGGGGHGGPGPSGDPDADPDWDSFERQFRDHVERRELVPA